MAGEGFVSRPIRVLIKRAPGLADLPLPARMTEHAAGFDLAAGVTEPVTLQPGEIRLIPCGFSMAIPHGYEAQVRPRSGLASKFGVTMINAPGTIDSDYRGELGVILVNLGREPFAIRRGERIAQLVIAPVVRPVLKEVGEASELGATERGPGGFGHTGR